MANFSKLIITDAGKQLLNLKLNSQQELLFTEMVMSERKYDITTLEGLTDLEDIKQRVSIRRMSRIENAIQIDSVFLNSDLEEGYFANTLGVYACLGADAPVLFAVAVEQVNAAYMPQKSQTLSGIEIKLKITLENADNITIQMDQSAMATVGDVLELERCMENHISDFDNPHQTDKAQVGLDKVENTSDMDKPVSTKQQEAIDAAYQQSTGYTDQKIADLINGAPNTLDTLGEIAKAMQDNDNVVDALEATIGTKASKAELDGHVGNTTVHITASERQNWNGKQTTTGDTKDNVVSFTSGDTASPTGWSDVALISSGEKHNSLWSKVSLFARNMRYLWKLMGSTSLNGIGDGTVTGAISQLNTGLGGKAASSHTHFKSQITDFPSALPASDVYAWAKAASKPGYSWGEISGKPSTFTPSSHTHPKSQITDFPSALPASDVYAWAKAASKPGYSWSEISGKPSTFTPSSHTHDNYLSKFGSSTSSMVNIHGSNCIYSAAQCIGFQPGSSGTSDANDYSVHISVRDSMWTWAPSRNGYVTLGSPNHRWGQPYLSTSPNINSDRNCKKDICPISDNHVEFFMRLQPVSYRYTDGTSGRIHIGFIAQEVESAMVEVGMSDLDFAGFCKDKVDDTYIYSLRYEEFIALNTAVIQRQQTKISNLERRLERLEAKSV